MFTKIHHLAHSNDTVRGHNSTLENINCFTCVKSMSSCPCWKHPPDSSIPFRRQSQVGVSSCWLHSLSVKEPNEEMQNTFDHILTTRIDTRVWRNAYYLMSKVMYNENASCILINSVWAILCSQKSGIKGNTHMSFKILKTEVH